MIFIKYVLIFLIFGIFTSIGNIYSKKYENRLRELEKMQNLLNIFKAKIKFTGQNIQEIFKQIYIDNKDNIGFIFKEAGELMEDENSFDAWNTSLEHARNSTSLQDDDINAIKVLGKMLGNTDIDGQISQIDLVSQLLREQIVQALEEKKKNEKVYKTLGLATGLTMAIILI